MQRAGRDEQGDAVAVGQLQAVGAALGAVGGGDAEGFAVVGEVGPFGGEEHAGEEGVVG